MFICSFSFSGSDLRDGGILTSTDETPSSFFIWAILHPLIFFLFLLLSSNRTFSLPPKSLLTSVGVTVLLKIGEGMQLDKRLEKPLTGLAGVGIFSGVVLLIFESWASIRLASLIMFSALLWFWLILLPAEEVEDLEGGGTKS